MDRAHTKGRERPILFSGPMVRALLDGRKTQTRRILKPQPNGDVIHYGWQAEGGAFWTDQNFESHRLTIWAGDRLWVREALDLGDTKYIVGHCTYAADGSDVDLTPTGAGAWAGAYKRRHAPGIHMPRWASRLTLTVTDVSVQRLQDISEEDARAEGVEPIVDHGVGNQHLHRIAFDQLWERIHGAGATYANPWVAAYTFNVERRNIDEGLGQRADATPSNSPSMEGR